MRTLLTALVLVVGAASVQAGEVQRFSFKKDQAGKLPVGWEQTQTGAGAGSVWKVVADATAPSRTGFALAQTAAGPKALFNLCVVKDSKFLDGEIRVQLRAVRGDEDQGGGLVWRYQDAKNYYICRFNPLEDNFRLYKVVDGKRMQMATKEGIKGGANEWHTLVVKQKGEQIECVLDGKERLEARDGTFAKAGRVGLWTKADAQTNFDALVIGGKE